MCSTFFRRFVEALNAFDSRDYVEYHHNDDGLVVNGTYDVINPRLPMIYFTSIDCDGATIATQNKIYNGAGLDVTQRTDPRTHNNFAGQGYSYIYIPSHLYDHLEDDAPYKRSGVQLVQSTLPLKSSVVDPDSFTRDDAIAMCTGTQPLPTYGDVSVNLYAPGSFVCEELMSTYCKTSTVRATDPVCSCVYQEELRRNDKTLPGPLKMVTCASGSCQASGYQFFRMKDQPCHATICQQLVLTEDTGLRSDIFNSGMVLNCGNDHQAEADAEAEAANARFRLDSSQKSYEARTADTEVEVTNTREHQLMVTIVTSTLMVVIVLLVITTGWTIRWWSPPHPYNNSSNNVDGLNGGLIRDEGPMNISEDIGW